MVVQAFKILWLNLQVNTLTTQLFFTYLHALTLTGLIYSGFVVGTIAAKSSCVQ